MNRVTRYPMWIIAALLLCIGSMAGGALIGASVMQAGHAPEAAVAAAAPPVREAATMPGTFAPVVKAVFPDRVNISSTGGVRAPALRPDNTFCDLFSRFPPPQ